MDGEKKRSAKRRSLEAGREMLARYKASLERNMEANQTGEPSDDELLHNDGGEQSIDQQSTSMIEDASCRDTTQSSISVSEGEGDGDIEGMAGRVAELKELLHGKEAMIETLSAEIEHMRAEASSPNSSQSHNSSSQYRDIFLIYQNKLQDFEQAVVQRDNLIQELTSSLEQALAARDAFKIQISALTAMPRSSQDSNSPIGEKERINILEQSLTNHVADVTQLNSQLNQSREYIRQLEIEKERQNGEINDYKERINYLNEQIRTVGENNDAMEIRKQYESRVAKLQSDIQKFKETLATCTNSNSIIHDEQIKELEAKHQNELAQLKQNYEQQYKILFERYNTELPALECKHAKELHVFQSQLLNSKKTIESIKSDLENRTKTEESVINELNEKLHQCQQDKLMLQEQINLHKVQVEEWTAKYVAVNAVLDSKESIEKSLEEAVESLKQDNDALRFKYDDMSARYAAVQSVIENNQVTERVLNNRLHDAEKSLSRLSGMSTSLFSEFNTTTYQTFDEAAMQIQMAKHRLEEKEKLEKQLVDRIQELEKRVLEANKELDEANIEKQLYEKQLKDMKNKSEKMISDLGMIKETNSSSLQPFQSDVYFPMDSEKNVNDSTLIENSATTDVLDKINSYEKEIESLRQLIEKKDKDYSEIDNKLRQAMEKVKQYKCDNEQMKKGLSRAWEQCAKFEGRLNETLAMNDSQFDETIGISALSNFSINLVDAADKSECANSNNSKLAITSRFEEENENISDHSNNLDNIQKKLEYLCVRSEQTEQVNQRLREENANILQMQENIEELKKSLEEVNAKNSLLVKEMANLIEKHNIELSAIRSVGDSSLEMKKIHSLLSNSEGESSLEKWRTELEKQHAKEMEELRTYFEEKCLQMEKQYSEEIFSQQSKKMSDDSEVDELTDDLYYGGGGDCVNLSKDSGDKTMEEIKNCDKNDIGNSNFVTTVDQLCQTEWDTNVENGELTELRAAYSNQLEEQVALAKRDIVNALQEQIQALLAVEIDSEENWPPELLELRNKFTNNAKREIEKLKSDHALEIAQLKEENMRNLSRTIERYQEDVDKFTEIVAQNQNTSDGVIVDDDIIKQRDNLYKSCVVLKDLISELVKYFVTCEDELNNTLITEVLKRKPVTDSQTPSDDCEDIVESASEFEKESTSPKSPKIKIKRVHFAPQSSRISRIIKKDADILFNFIDEENDIARELRAELEKCLQRMKTESAQIFGINLTSGGSMLDTLSKQISWTTKINEELSVKLSEAESTIDQYEVELQQLKSKYIDLQEKLITVDTKKEIVSEGYGEQDNSGNETVLQNLTQLHEKARLAIMSGAGDNSYLLQLIEELCTSHDKLRDETIKEKEDLQQQIEAADKQLRSTRKFLEEQASEREIERDDAARHIHALQEEIKEREREKVRDLRKTSESSLSSEASTITPLLQEADGTPVVEALEIQIREMSSTISELDSKRLATETELKTAVDKIWELREIIVDLELQIQAKLEKETDMLNQIDQMREVITTQTRFQQELVHELEANKISTGESQMNDHIIHLQEELRKHKLSTEHFNVNSTALKQMKSELHDMSTSLDKRIKELEALHMCGSNLSISQPSEDVSIRDQIDATRCLTPDDPNAPPTLPLDQLLKLKDKMVKHARAEEVAFKRMKDLDMQLAALKIQNEELQAEQEMLQHTASEQLFQIEAMRGRLEQQKQNAPFAQKQATSRLELQLHDANAKLHGMEQTLEMKELELKEVRTQLSRVSQLLNEKQEEIMNAVEAENNLIQELKNRVQLLADENKVMESKIKIQEHEQQQLPNLIHSMMTDRDDEIEHLKKQLSRKEEQLQALTASMNADENNGGKQNEPKNSARTLSDILSIHSECEEIGEAIREVSHDVRNDPHNISSMKGAILLPQSKDQFDGSSVHLVDLQKPELHIPTLNLGSQQHSFASPQHVSHPQLSMQSELDLKSPSIGCSTTSDLSGGSSTKSRNSPRSQALNNKTSPSKMQSLNCNSPEPTIEDLKNRLKAIYKELQSKSATLSERNVELDSLQKSFDKMRAEYKDSIDTLTRDKLFYKNQYELCQESESKIRKDLEEVENYLKVKTEELDICKEKVQVNERILTEIQSENGALKKSIDKMCEENSTYQITIQEKISELKNLKEIIFEKDITIESIKMRNEEIENENKQLYEFKTKFESCRKDLIECQNEIKRLTDGINNRDELLQRLEEMAARRSSTSGEYSPCDKDQEIYHLREHSKAKDKIIKQISDDSKSLHRNLEKIQNKMKESGNVVELRRKLKEEKMFNSELTKMLAKLKQELELLKDESQRQSMEDVDIEDMVQRELNLSADLDKKIMSVIESESEEMLETRKIDRQLCNPLMIKPVEEDLEKIMQQYTEIRQKLKQANKLNEELNHQKDELEIDRELLKSQVIEYENRIIQIKTDIDKDNQRTVQLMNDLSEKNSKIRNLEIQLQKEKSALRNEQVQDSKLIGNLRVKLASSLEAEEKLRDSLTFLRQQNKTLELKLVALKEQMELGKVGDAPIYSPPLQDIEQQNDVALSEKYEKSARELIEVNNALKTVQMERNRYETELNIQIEEREKLLNKIALTEGAKERLEVSLKRTKEKLKSRDEECEWLQKRIKTMSDAEEKRQKQRSDDQSVIKNYRIEIENLKSVMKDLEIDTVDMKQQLKISQTETSQATQVVMALRKSEVELQKKLDASKNEGEKLRMVIANLESDLQARMKMELQFPKEDMAEKNLSSQLIEQMGKLTCENERYSNEKIILHDKLIRAREDIERYTKRLSELESKAQQFYGRYLRVDSKRKALIFQKRYLLCVIGGYQLTDDMSTTVIAQLTNSERTYISERTLDMDKKNPKARFRCVALMIIGIHRMKWTVQRWRGGLRRTAANFVVENIEHSFPAFYRNSMNHSPPVRDQRNPFLNDNPVNVYENYAQRLLNIQQNLGLVLTEEIPTLMQSE